mgnify:CR=1 FL=1
MLQIIRKVHVHMPYSLLPQHLPMVLEKKLNPEIYFSHVALQSLDKNQCAGIARALGDAGLKVTFHAPFMDLRPGALDDKIRQASLDRVPQVFDMIHLFRPLEIICPPSFGDTLFSSFAYPLPSHSDYFLW